MSDWADAEIATLAELAGEHWSASMIGAKLGRTRNSVIAKAGRNGIELDYNRYHNRNPPSEAIRRRRDKERERRREMRKKAETLPRPPRPPRILPNRPAAEVYALALAKREPRPKPIEVAPESKKLTLQELNDSMCRYIEDELPTPLTYCAHDAISGTSWCPFHYSVVFNKPEIRRRVRAENYQIRRD